MPYADLENLKLYYEEYSPTAESSETKVHPVLFLHGFTLDRRMWAAQAAFFSARYRVILLDALGHGLSDAPETGYGRAHRVEHLHGFADHLDLTKFHLVGLSMGGTTGIGYALTHQDRLASLTLVSTGAAGYNAGRKISHLDRLARKKGIEAARKKWRDIALSWYRHGQSEVRELMGKMMDENPGVVWGDPMRGQYPHEYHLEKVHAITIPTMIFAGAEDHIFLPLAKSLHEKITDSKLKIYEGVGHMINLEAPEKFNRDLKQFLEMVEGHSRGAVSA